MRAGSLRLQREISSRLSRSWGFSTGQVSRGFLNMSEGTDFVVHGNHISSLCPSCGPDLPVSPAPYLLLLVPTLSVCLTSKFLQKSTLD